VSLVTLQEGFAGMPNTRAHPFWKHLLDRPSGTVPLCDFAEYSDLRAGLRQAGVEFDGCPKTAAGQSAAAVQLTPRYLLYVGERIWRLDPDDGGGNNQPAAATTLDHPDCQPSGRGPDEVWSKCIGNLQVDAHSTVPIANVSKPLLIWRRSDRLLFLVTYQSANVFKAAQGEMK
jgi:hypothetical protein